MPISRSGLRAILILWLLAGLTHPAGAQNLLVNGRFEQLPACSPASRIPNAQGPMPDAVLQSAREARA